MPGPKSKRKRLQVSNLGNWGVKKRKVVKDTESDKENVLGSLEKNLSSVYSINERGRPWEKPIICARVGANRNNAAVRSVQSQTLLPVQGLIRTTDMQDVLENLCMRTIINWTENRQRGHPRSTVVTAFCPSRWWKILQRQVCWWIVELCLHECACIILIS